MERYKNCPVCSKQIAQDALRCDHCGSIFSTDSDTGNFIGFDRQVQEALAGRYTLKGVVGSGGMAVVYKAVQLSLNRTVALKVVHENLVHDSEFLKRFIREAQVSASLNHRNIVTVYDVGIVGKIHYMAMEYLPGMTLRDLIRKNDKLKPDQINKYIAPIADALAYIHKQGLVHRDMKSSNVIITKGNRPVLTDFGIVYINDDIPLSSAGAIVGTPEYMSPEQAEGKLELDGRSDIFSLGIVLYEAATGRVPFHAKNPLGTIHQVIYDDPVPPRKLSARLPVYVNNLIMDCLIKDRNRRIDKPSTIASALRYEKYKSSSYSSEKNLTRKIFKDSSKRSISAKPQSQKRVVRKEGSKRLQTVLLILFVILVALAAGIAINDSISKQRSSKQLSQLIGTVDQNIEENSSQGAIDPLSGRTVAEAQQRTEGEETTPLIQPESSGPETRPDAEPEGINTETEATGTVEDDNSAASRVFEDQTEREPETEIRPRFGTLSIRPDPSGAEVILNGVKLGESPLILEDLPVGSYQVELKKEGYTDIKRSFEVEENRTTQVRMQMPMITYQITIESDPPDALIFIGNEQIGTTAQKIMLPPGLSSLTIKKPFFQNKNLIVNPNSEDKTHKVEMRRMECEINIQVSAPGARLTLRSISSKENYGLSFFKRYNSSEINETISCGEYRLIIEKEGYENIEEQLRIETTSYRKYYNLPLL